MSRPARSEKSIWDIAYEERLRHETSYMDPALLEKDSSQENPNNSCILLCGSRNCGKSSLILRFLERDELPKPTVALDYTFGRIPRSHKMIKDVCHIYELGAGTSMSHLLDCFINSISMNPSKFSIIIVLDLSKPSELWNTQEVLINEINTLVSKIFQEASCRSPCVAGELKERCWQRIGVNHEDKHLIEPSIIPVLIIGGRYDKFQEFDPEKKKVICKTLRFIAHRIGASLQFTSTEIDSLVSRTRSFLSYMAFNSGVGKASNFDHHKPLLVNAGQDTFASIGTPPMSSERLQRSVARSSIDLWKDAFLETFPQEKSSKDECKQAPVKDQQYAEPLIDALRLQKDQELAIHKKKPEEGQKGNYNYTK